MILCGICSWGAARSLKKENIEKALTSLEHWPHSEDTETRLLSPPSAPPGVPRLQPAGVAAAQHIVLRPRGPWCLQGRPLQIPWEISLSSRLETCRLCTSKRTSELRFFSPRSHGGPGAASSHSVYHCEVSQHRVCQPK